MAEVLVIAIEVSGGGDAGVVLNAVARGLSGIPSPSPVLSGTIHLAIREDAERVLDVFRNPSTEGTEGGVAPGVEPLDPRNPPSPPVPAPPGDPTDYNG